MVKKRYVFRFDRVHERDRRTDGADRQTPHDSIGRAHAMHSIVSKMVRRIPIGVLAFSGPAFSASPNGPDGPMVVVLPQMRSRDRRPKINNPCFRDL